MKLRSLCIQIILAYSILFVFWPARQAVWAGTWDSVFLSNKDSIDKIAPGGDGVYYISEGKLKYWRFNDKACADLSHEGAVRHLDCVLTREGYLAAGCWGGQIEIYSGAELLPDFGFPSFIDYGLRSMDIAVTGEDSLVFICAEGTFRVFGEKYNSRESLPLGMVWSYICTSHSGVLWSAQESVPELPMTLIVRTDRTTSMPMIFLPEAFRGFCCDSTDTLWIATESGLYRMPSDVPVTPWPGSSGEPEFPKEFTRDTGYPGPPPTAIECDSAGRVLVGVNGDGLYLYDRNAWTHITTADGLSGNDIRCLGTAPDNRFYAAGNGWFSFEKKSTVAVEENSTLKWLKMDPPRPNPSNASVSVGYSLNHDSIVEVALFNVLGQKVMTLSNGFVMSGYHQISLSAHNLASGLYFVHIEANGLHSITKLTVMK